MTLERESVDFAIRIQSKGYKLLQWMESALQRGFIAPERVSHGAEDKAAVVTWLERHLANLPPQARPTQEEIEPLGLFFSTFLNTTFHLKAEPGMRLQPGICGCFCPMCSWMVQRPHLQTRKVGRREKLSARKRMLGTLAQWRLELGLDHRPDAELESLVEDPELRADLALCTYLLDLERRLEGRSKGAATLALWRMLAWNANGSPIKKFKLQSDRVLEAQERILAKLQS